jgi:hypothetical protein
MSKSRRYPPGIAEENSIGRMSRVTAQPMALPHAAADFIAPGICSASHQGNALRILGQNIKLSAILQTLPSTIAFGMMKLAVDDKQVCHDAMQGPSIEIQLPSESDNPPEVGNQPPQVVGRHTFNQPSPFYFPIMLSDNIVNSILIPPSGSFKPITLGSFRISLFSIWHADSFVVS